MAYTPREWTCGDKITADSLNNIEDGIQEALECCADKGYECTETRTKVIDASVTTVALPTDGARGTFPGETVINVQIGDTVDVTINGTEHSCVVRADEEDPTVFLIGDENADGFVIVCGSETPMLFTLTAGTYIVEGETVATTVTTSECFEKAVKGIVGYECTETRTLLFDGNVTTTQRYDAPSGSFSAYFDLPTKATVTFNGAEYTCDGDGWILGDRSFTYPFYITAGFEGGNPILFTQNAGTYSVKVEAIEESVDTSACFEKAVKRFTGFDCEYRELFEETVTVSTPTNEDLSYSDLIDAESVRVTFNGVEYGCERRVNNDPISGITYEYGADHHEEDFSEYPFEIVSSETTGLNILYVNESGTYTIKVEIATSSTTPCFEQAVKSATKGALIINLHTETADNVNFLVTDKTLYEIIEAYDAGRRILIKEYDASIQSEVFFEVYHLFHEYDSEVGEAGKMKAVYFRNESQYSTTAPYWDADPPTVYTTTYSNGGIPGHPSFSPYLSRYNGQGIG